MHAQLHTTMHELMHSSWSLKYAHVFIFQPVALPVAMEEGVIAHLPMLTASVPAGTEDPTVRTEVCMHNYTQPCM